MLQMSQAPRCVDVTSVTQAGCTLHHVVDKSATKMLVFTCLSLTMMKRSAAQSLPMTAG
jgi:hypothetical protein